MKKRSTIYGALGALIFGLAAAHPSLAAWTGSVLDSVPPPPWDVVKNLTQSVLRIENQGTGNAIEAQADQSGTALYAKNQGGGNAITAEGPSLFNGNVGIGTMDFNRAKLVVNSTSAPQLMIDSGEYLRDFSKQVILRLQAKGSSGENWRNDIVTDTDGDLVLKKSTAPNSDPTIDALTISSAGQVMVNAPVGPQDVTTKSYVDTSHYYNVKNVGARGDGVTNDTAAIQAVINAHPEGGTVYIPAGSYLVDTIEVKSRITLTGDGDATRLVQSGGNAAGVTAYDQDNVRVENLKISADAVWGGGGIAYFGVRNGIIDNVTVENGAQTSVSILRGSRPSENVIVQNSRAFGQRFFDGGVGKASFIAAEGARHITFLNDYAKDNNADMYDADDAYDVSFINCVAENGPNVGFWSEATTPEPHDVTFQNVKAINTAGGIGVTFNVRAIITDSIVENVPDRAIWVHATNYDTQISNVRLSKTGKTGDAIHSPIHIDTLKPVTVSNVHFENTFSPFDLTLYGYQATMTGPYIIEGSQFTKGIRVSEGSTVNNIVIKGNTFRSSGVTNYNYANNVLIDSNIFLEGGVGFCNANDVVVSNNTFIGADQGTAIELVCDSQRARITENLIRDYATGIKMYGGVGFASATGNSIFSTATPTHYEVWAGPGGNYFEVNAVDQVAAGAVRYHDGRGEMFTGSSWIPLN